MREKEELKAANTREQEEIQQLRQQVSDTVTSLYNGHSHPDQLSVISIAEEKRGAAPLGGKERGGGAD